MARETAYIAVQPPGAPTFIIVVAIKNGHGIDRELTPELIAAEIAASGMAGKPFRVVDPKDFPGDGTFRAAWVDTGKIDVDMIKAVEIHKDRLRKIREPILAALDVAQIKALAVEDKATVATLEAQKQALRDVTSDASIAAAKTPDELKAAVPDVLKVAAPVETIKR